MENDKILDTLFEKAREEKPHIDYEKVSTRFIASLSAVGILLSLKSLLKNINLNSIIMITTATVIVTSIILGLSFNTNPETPPENIQEILAPTDTTKTKKAVTGKIEELKIQDLKSESLLNPIKEKGSIKPLFKQPIINDLVVTAETLDIRDTEALETIELQETAIAERIPQEKLEMAEPKRLEKKIEPIRVRIEEKKIIELSKCTNQSELDLFTGELVKLGFETKVDWDFFTRDEKCLESFKVKLKNEDGMNLRLKVKGFSTFSFLYELDEHGNVKRLLYQVNKLKQSTVGLNSRNRISIEVINESCEVTYE